MTFCISTTVFPDSDDWREATHAVALTLHVRLPGTGMPRLLIICTSDSVCLLIKVCQCLALDDLIAGDVKLQGKKGPVRHGPHE